MNTPENNFENELRTKLKSYEEGFSSDTWLKIEKKLDKPTQRRFFIYLNTFLAIDLLAVLFAYSFTQNQQLKSKTLTSNFSHNEHLVSVQKTLLRTTESDVQTKGETEIKIKTRLSQGVVQFKKAAKTFSATAHTKSGSINKNNFESKTGSALSHLNTTSKSELTFQNTKKENTNNTIIGEFTKKAPNELNLNLINSLRTDTQKVHTGEKIFASISNSDSKSIISNNNDEVTKSADSIAQVSSGESGNIDLTDTIFKKKWRPFFSFDLLGGPDVNGRKIQSNDSLVFNYLNKRDSAEKISFGYTVQARINVNLNRNFYFQSGILYTYRKENFNIRNRYGVQSEYIDSSKVTSYVDPFGPTIIVKEYDTLQRTDYYVKDLQHNLQIKMIEIPFIFGYRIPFHKTAFYAQAGLIFNHKTISSGNWIPSRLNNVSDTQNSELMYKTQTGFSFNLSTGIEWDLKRGWSILTEPSFRCNLNNMLNDATGLNLRQRSMGVYTGLRYTF